jgi:hypothetical protein
MFVNPVKPKFVWMLFKNSVRTAKKTPHFTVTKISWLTLFKEIIAPYSKNHTKSVNALHGQNAELLDVKADGKYNYHSDVIFEMLQNYAYCCKQVTYFTVSSSRISHYWDIWQSCCLSCLSTSCLVSDVASLQCSSVNRVLVFDLWLSVGACCSRYSYGQLLTTSALWYRVTVFHHTELTLFCKE